MKKGASDALATLVRGTRAVLTCPQELVSPPLGALASLKADHSKRA